MVLLLVCLVYLLVESRSTLGDPLLQPSLPESSSINILYLKSQSLDNEPFRSKISALTGGTTEYFDGVTATPTLEQLSQYTCVMVHFNSNFLDLELLGDVLADYVDQTAGVVVFSDGFTGGGFTDDRGVKGRIRGIDYSPIAEVELGLECESVYSMDGTTLIYDGITTNFRSISNNRDGGVTLQGNGIADGTFEDGHIAAAYRPDFRVCISEAATVGEPPLTNSVVQTATLFGDGQTPVPLQML